MRRGNAEWFSCKHSWLHEHTKLLSDEHCLDNSFQRRLPGCCYNLLCGVANMRDPPKILPFRMPHRGLNNLVHSHRNNLAAVARQSSHCEVRETRDESSPSSPLCHGLSLPAQRNCHGSQLMALTRSATFRRTPNM